MKLNRFELKASARETIHRSDPRIITAGLLYLLLTVVIGVLSSRLMGSNISRSEMTNYFQYFIGGDYDGIMKYSVEMLPPRSAYIIDALLRFVLEIVGAGFLIFLLNTVRSNAPCFGNLLDGFGFALKIILLSILEGVFIALWSILLIFPGIIAAYHYSQALYILIDDPSKSPMQCLRESKRMMYGHKWELFVLDLSFIGWLILAGLPIVGYAVRVWSEPFIRTTKTMYYDRLVNACDI